MCSWLKQKSESSSRKWNLCWQGESLLQIDQSLMRWLAWPPAEAELKAGANQPLELLQAVVQKAAYRWCLHRLSQQARSGHQLIQRLQVFGIPQQWALQVIAQLQAEGYIEDLSMAERIEQRMRQRGRSYRQIQQILDQQGLPSQVKYDPKSEVDSAVAWLTRWSKTGDLHAQRDRYLQRLARRGFDSSTIYEAYRIWLADHPLGAE